MFSRRNFYKLNAHFTYIEDILCKTYPVSAFQRFSVSALACFSLAGCQVVNDALSTANGVLSTVNATLSKGSSVLSNSPISGGIYVDPQTEASVLSAINKSKASNDVAKLFAQAKPTIQEVIGKIACGTDNRLPLNRYTAPNELGFGISNFPTFSMKHHRSGCVNVLRINNFKKLAANAFAFEVVYQSPQSEETVNRGYQALKQPDGEWLFSWYYY